MTQHTSAPKYGVFPLIAPHIAEILTSSTSFPAKRRSSLSPTLHEQVMHVHKKTNMS